MLNQSKDKTMFQRTASRSVRPVVGKGRLGGTRA